MNSTGAKCCSDCGLEQALSEYHLISKGGSKRRAQCKDCRNLWRRKRYALDPDSNTEQRIKQQRNLYWLAVYKKETGCQTCGGDFPPGAMEFHHREGRGPDDRVVSMIANQGWPRILEELAKCDVVCGSCHNASHRKKWDWIV